MTSFFDYPDTPAAPADDDDAVFLGQASDAEWEALRAHADSRVFRAGQVVVDVGEADRALLIVLSGQAEVTVPSGRRGRERRLATIEPGTVLGEVSFFDGRPRSAAVRALTDLRVLRLTREAFDVLAAKEPALGRQILFDIGRALASRLRDVEALR